MRKKITIALLILTGFSLDPINILNGNNTLSKKTVTSFEIPINIFVLKSVSSNTLTFQDKRDNKTYRQIRIGTQVWMAENLNYGKLVLNMEQTNNGIAEKTYYNNDTSLGSKMGALYTWEEISNYEKSTGTKLIQGLCPDGWHLPSDAEWTSLTNFLDNKVDPNGEGWLGKNIAVLLIDSTGTKSKFKIKFGGNSVSNWFFHLNELGYYWTSTRYSSASAWYRSVSKNSKQIFKGPGDIKLGMSIRCVKD